MDADDPAVIRLLNRPTTEQLRSIIGDNRIVFIDEAQRIPQIGLTLKIITDNFKKVQLIVTGSSSFDLSNYLNEPLTGRKWEYRMYPVSWEEFEDKEGYLFAEQQLENRLIYGFYPDVLNNKGNEKEVLRNLVSSYLYKDVLAFAKMRKPEILNKLLQALALQIGSEVNIFELSNTLGVDKNTIVNYLDILEKGFVIFKLGSFSKNLRKEIKKNRKIYFYDTGIRNALLGNFAPLDLRNDKGALWENFLVAERFKHNEYHKNYAKCYFWRTQQKQEIDFVEEMDGGISAFEFKWNSKNYRFPKNFVETYNPKTEVIDRGNFREFVRKQ